jgi:hypothetical protein
MPHIWLKRSQSEPNNHRYYETFKGISSSVRFTKCEIFLYMWLILSLVVLLLTKNKQTLFHTYLNETEKKCNLKILKLHFVIHQVSGQPKPSLILEIQKFYFIEAPGCILILLTAEYYNSTAFTHTQIFD